MNVLDRELACMLVGLGVWIDIDSKRAGYMSCVCTLEEFLIYHRCWFCMLSNIWWLCIIKGLHTFQQGWVNIDSYRKLIQDWLLCGISNLPSNIYSTQWLQFNPWMFPPWRFYHIKKSLVSIFSVSLFHICICVSFNLVAQYSLVMYFETRFC